MNRYSSESAAQRAAAGQRGGLARGARPRRLGVPVAATSSRRGFLDGAAGFALATYVAEGTFWRYLKIAEHARRLPTEG